MSEAGGADEAGLGRLRAGDEARVLPGLEVLRHRRRHDDDGGEDVGLASAAMLGGRREVLRLLVEVAAPPR